MLIIPMLTLTLCFFLLFLLIHDFFFTLGSFTPCFGACGRLPPLHFHFLLRTFASFRLIIRSAHKIPPLLFWYLRRLGFIWPCYVGSWVILASTVIWGGGGLDMSSVTSEPWSGDSIAVGINVWERTGW